MLNITKDCFYSIQGEGSSNGVPAYFIRLANCNLRCGGVNGKLVKTGKATWWCDTESVWLKGTNRENEWLIQKWIDENILNDIISGDVHLVWTGGEPLIKNNAEGIIQFLEYFNTKYKNNLYNEIETNGTKLIPDTLFGMLHQINCSPKLSNSGLNKKSRIKEKVIEQINTHRNSWFKFVVSSEDDVNELIQDFVIPFNLNKSKIILMPALDDQEDFFKDTQLVFELAKKYKVRAVSRMQIAAWGMVTGV
jgi:7-carboxy-7-deazaguanine synthase